MWRSFCYDENVETIDAYVNRMKQVTELLNYGKPQILKLFKNTLLSKLCWVLFSINNLRDVVDAAKRLLTKEKIDRWLSVQSGATAPFMKVGDVHHSNKTVSFNMQDPIREQLENLTSMVYNMSIQQEENNKPFKPQIHQKKRRGQNRQNFGDRDRNRSYSRGRWREDFRPNYRRQPQGRCIQHGVDSMRGSYRCQNYDNRSNRRDRGRKNFRRNMSNDRYDSRDRNRSRTRERSLTPRRIDRRHDSPKTNLGTRNRSNSRVTTNKYRVRCFRYREYAHVATECHKSVTDDSDGYESDGVALQMMTAETENDNFDTTRLSEEQEYLDL